MSDHVDERPTAGSLSQDAPVASEAAPPGLEERRPVSIEDADVVAAEGRSGTGRSGSAAEAVGGSDGEPSGQSGAESVTGTRVARAGEAGPETPTVHPHGDGTAPS